MATLKMQNMTATTQVRILVKRKHNRSGISVIEVLVAIAILSIGMLSILLLFPAGLVALQNGAASTNADRLGQAEIEKASAGDIQLLNAVYPSAYSGFNSNTLASVNPETLIQTSIPTTSPLTNQSDVDAFRTIQGETVRIPSLNASDVSLYTVVADPIESESLTVNGTPWTGIAGDSTPNPTNPDYADPGAELAPGQPQYLIDYANGEICLSAETSGQTYQETIVFTVTGSNGQVVTQTLNVPALDVSAQPVWVSLSQLMTPSNTTGTEPPTPWTKGSDILVRNFTQVPYGGTFSTQDPYQWQYYLPDYASANPSSATAPSANLGVIAFNPLATFLHGPDGKPLEAVLNYRTYSWHIISEDRLVTSPLGTAHLSLTSLLADTAKDFLSDNTTAFTGLFTYSDPVTYGGAITPADPDFIVLDMDKGTVLQEGTDYSVDYSNGTVSFINPNGTYANDHLRIFYHPARDWAVALAKAPVVYTADTTPGDVAQNEPALSEYISPVTGTTIYFPEVDLGKQVDIRFSYTVPGSGGAESYTTTTENMYTIEAAGMNAGVDLTGVLNNQATTIPAGSYNITPLAVKGVSLSAIVIWKDNSIWHNRTISTVLTSPSQESATDYQ